MRRYFIAILGTFCCVTPPVLGAAEFWNMGAPSPEGYCLVNAISGDGSTAVGDWYDAIGGSLRGFRWTAAQGLQFLDTGSSTQRISEASGVSYDGSVVVGRGRHDLHNEGFRLTSAGMTWLGDLPGGVFGSDATAVSGNGSVVAGMAQSSKGTEAFRWTEQSGMTALWSDSSTGFARGISGDGSVIAGRYVLPDGSMRAFRWTAQGGREDLGDLPGGTVFADAYGVSANGAVIVGESGSSTGSQAFRWTQAGGMESLGSLSPGGSHARAISGDGSVIVGAATVDSKTAAFIWSHTLGMRNLQSLLESKYQLDLAGWSLTSANAISADGLTIAGSGYRGGNSQTFGWVVHLPEPSSLLLLVAGAVLLRRRSVA